MQPVKGLKRFKLNPLYTHHRSEGLTRRTNGGSFLQFDGEHNEKGNFAGGAGGNARRLRRDDSTGA